MLASMLISLNNIYFYQQIPAKTSASVTVPDYDYALTIPANTTVATNDGTNQSFLIEDLPVEETMKNFFENPNKYLK